MKFIEIVVNCEQFHSPAGCLQNLLEKNVPTNPQLWGRAKALAKKKFKIYPSAYANAWAAKKYRSWGGRWK